MKAVLPALRLGITCVALTDLVLPVYKGATLRGLLTCALRSECCDARDRPCTACSNKAGCASAMLEKGATSNGEKLPNPYTLNASALNDRHYAKGTEFSFDITLFGPAAGAVERVVDSMSRWHCYDLSRFKAFVGVSEVQEFGPPSRWHLQDWIQGRLELAKVQESEEQWTLPSALRLVPAGMRETGPTADHWRAELSLQSPCRFLEKSKAPVRTETMCAADIFLALARRIEKLRHHFCGVPRVAEDVLRTAVSKQCEDVELNKHGASDELIVRWKKGRRRFDPSDASVGCLILTKVPDALVPWIAVGQALQVGKLTTHGFGFFRAAFAKEPKEGK